MHPILFEIFGYQVHSFGVMVALGFAMGLLRMLKIAPKYNINPDRIFDIGIISLVTGLIGSRLLYVIIKHNEYTLKTSFEIWNGGLSFHGGLILAIGAIWVYSKINKLNFLRILDILAPSLCIAYAFGRIGCFLNGCCYGIPTESFLGVPMPTSSGIILSQPTQIYSALSGIAMFLILRKLEFNNKRDGFVLVNFLLLYGIYRFLIEFLRSHKAEDFVFGIITQGQVISILIILLSCVLLVLFYRKGTNKS